MENLKTERAIHTGIFFLLLAGLWGVSAWGLSTYVQDALLKFGGIALGWGVILLVLYVVFRQFDWTWWA